MRQIWVSNMKQKQVSSYKLDRQRGHHGPTPIKNTSELIPYPNPPYTNQKANNPFSAVQDKVLHSIKKDYPAHWSLKA